MILVTGGNGMLGRAVIEQLLENGHAVRCFDLTDHSSPSVESVVGGQVFHVTDHHPESIQDFMLDMLAPLGYQRARLRIPLPVMFFMARLLALPYYLTNAERFANPQFSQHQLLLATQDYYRDDGKAERLLGYAPRFTRTEAMERTQDWLSQQM